MKVKKLAAAVIAAADAGKKDNPDNPVTAIVGIACTASAVIVASAATVIAAENAVHAASAAIVAAAEE